MFWLLIEKMGDSYCRTQNWKKIETEELQELCKKNLAPFKVPKGFIFMDELPKTPSGKILKRDLRKEYEDHFNK